MLLESGKHKINSLENSYILFVAFFGLLMPFSLILNINALILALIFLLSCTLYYKDRNNQISKNRNYSLLSMVLFFVIVTLSMFYTEETNTGLKVTLRILPIFLFAASFLLIEEISKKSLKIILKFYAIGCLIAIIYCFAVALFSYNENPLAITEGFTYFTAPLDFHPSYFGVYTIFAFCIYISLLDFDTLKKKIFICLVWFLLLSFLFFLRSRAPIIIYLFISLIALFIRIKKIVLIIALLVFFILIFFNYYEILTLISNGRDLGMTIDERFNIWMNSLFVIKENLLVGVGIGDTQMVLDKQYFLSGFEKGIDHKYNSHNQFLQTFMSNGLIGLVSLLFIFLLLFQKAIRVKSILIYNFLVCVLILMLFDSVLILQHGVYFFAFFASILLKVNFKTNEAQ